MAVAALFYLTLRPGMHAQLCSRHADAGSMRRADWQCFTGVLQGAWDYYVLDRYQRLANSQPFSEVCILAVACALKPSAGS